MQTYPKGKCYDNQGLLTRSGVQVIIDDNRVMIGDSTYPIGEVEIDRDKRTITSTSGWSVTY